MTSYIAITDAETDPEAPLTSELAKKWRDNPIAIAEDDGTAPKIKRKSFVSGVSASTQTFTGLGDYGGVEFDTYSYSAGFSHTLTILYSTNGGSTFSTAFTLGSASANLPMTGRGSFDFATGTVSFAGMRSDGQTQRASGTMAGASLDINAIRLSVSSGGLVAMIYPNGGTV